MKSTIEQRLHQVCNALILNASFTDKLGLLDGKMGILIFFYHYSRYFQNHDFEEYAEILLDEIYQDITKLTPYTFPSGLTGIGWGIEYLVRNKFVVAETDEALEDIDTLIWKYETEKQGIWDKLSIICDQSFYQWSRWQNCVSYNTPTTIIKREKLAFLIDKYESLILQKSYSIIEPQKLTAKLACASLYFLIKLFESNILQVRIKYLIEVLVYDYILQIAEHKSRIELHTLKLLLSRTIQIVQTDAYIEAVKKYISYLDEKMENIIKNTDILIEEYTEFEYYQLIYQDLVFEKYQPSASQVMDIILDYKWWNLKLSSINNCNLGLRNGLAGIGFSLLNHLKQ